MTVTTVYVGGLTENIGNDELQDEFDRFGPVKAVWVARHPSSKGYAFVDYYHEDHALEAVREMDGRFCFGSQIKVELSKSEFDKNDKSSQHQTGGSKDRSDRPRQHHRSDSPRRERYSSPSPRRRRANRSPISDHRRSRSSDRRSQSLDKSAANTASSEFPDFVLRNAITLILLRDPLLLRAASVMGENGVQSKAENTDRSSFDSRPRPCDRRESRRTTHELLDILAKRQALDFNETLSQHTALENFLTGQSSFGFMNSLTQNPSLPVNPNLPAMLSNPRPIFTNGNRPMKSSSSSAPCDMTNNWYLNRYYRYPLFPSASTAMPTATADKTSVSSQPISQQQTAPIFPVRMSFPPAMTRPPRMPPRR